MGPTFVIAPILSAALSVHKSLAYIFHIGLVLQSRPQAHQKIL